jgi:hypothetical protein
VDKASEWGVLCEAKATYNVRSVGRISVVDGTEDVAVYLGKLQIDDREVVAAENYFFPRLSVNKTQEVLLARDGVADEGLGHAQ